MEDNNNKITGKKRSNEEIVDPDENVLVPKHLRSCVSPTEWNIYRHLVIEKDWKMKLIVSHRMYTKNRGVIKRIREESYEFDMESFQFEFGVKTATFIFKMDSYCFMQRLIPNMKTTFVVMLTNDKQDSHILHTASADYPSKKPYNFQSLPQELIMYQNGEQLHHRSLMYFKFSTCSRSKLIKFFDSISFGHLVHQMQDKKDFENLVVNHALEASVGHGGYGSRKVGLENSESLMRSHSEFSTSTFAERDDPYELKEVMCKIPSNCFLFANRHFDEAEWHRQRQAEDFYSDNESSDDDEKEEEEEDDNNNKEYDNKDDDQSADKNDDEPKSHEQAYLHKSIKNESQEENNAQALESATSESKPDDGTQTQVCNTTSKSDIETTILSTLQKSE